jgi:hypothetical protein
LGKALARYALMFGVQAKCSEIEMTNWVIRR